METFFNSPILQALAALWLATGFVKSMIVVQQVPAIAAWWTHYKFEDDEKTEAWAKKPSILICAIIMMVMVVVLFTVCSPMFLIVRRERFSQFFTPYSDCFLAYAASQILKMPVGVEPGEFEEWDDYQERIGFDPAQVAEDITIVNPKVPQSIERIQDTAERLRDLQDRQDIVVAEDEEFRDK
jgi:hypothetical protein